MKNSALLNCQRPGGSLLPETKKASYTSEEMEATLEIGEYINLGYHSIARDPASDSVWRTVFEEDKIAYMVLHGLQLLVIAQWPRKSVERNRSICQLYGIVKCGYPLIQNHLQSCGTMRPVATTILLYRVKNSNEDVM